MNASVPGGGQIPQDPIVPLLERLWDLLRQGVLGSYEAATIERVIRWLRGEVVAIDRRLINELRIIAVKAPMPWVHIVAIGDTIKALEKELSS
jgi:hypothetical protein